MRSRCILFLEFHLLIIPQRVQSALSVTKCRSATSATLVHTSSKFIEFKVHGIWVHNIADKQTERQTRQTDKQTLPKIWPPLPSKEVVSMWLQTDCSSVVPWLQTEAMVSCISAWKHKHSSCTWGEHIVTIVLGSCTSKWACAYIRI